MDLHFAADGTMTYVTEHQSHLQAYGDIRRNDKLSFVFWKI